jgi:D-sedoheptulose 7-phosphate isomerase
LTTAASTARLEEFAAARVRAGEALFGAQADRIARLCHRMAERFARGGRLIAVGEGPAARSDVRHVAVEFVHPVIVGKRALPALGLTTECVAQVGLLVESDDMLLAFEPSAAVEVARGRGALTVGFEPGPAEWVFEPSGDGFVRQELVETLYHVLWELVHVFFDHRGLLEGREVRPVHDTGASSFLYPFLAERETDLESVVGDVRASVLAKARETAELREQTLLGNADALLAGAEAMRASFAAGGRVLALGNGGSATDAMDAAADLRSPPPGFRAHPALDLTEDAAILTAITNDVGVEPVFARQIIAHGRPGDTALAFSTSGGSANVIAALAEARRLGLRTIALVGYDGGRIAAERLADHVIVTSSQHIPRIQEAQATAWHALRELVEDGE